MRQLRNAGRRRPLLANEKEGKGVVGWGGGKESCVCRATNKTVPLTAMADESFCDKLVLTVFRPFLPVNTEYKVCCTF